MRTDTPATQGGPMTTPPVPGDVLDVEAVRARAAAATAGPWGWGDFADDERLVFEGEPPQSSAICVMVESGVAADKSDAEFIARARTDIEMLCDEVDRLRAALRRLVSDRGVQAITKAECTFVGEGPCTPVFPGLVVHPSCAIAAARALLDGTDG